jgi:HD-GYP domain-containing protein (c-di-GMP phosphodiesterase class II)
MFHDLGKQRIPKKILRKTQSLTLAELKLVQLHTQYGVEIINTRVPSFPPESLEIIRNHHEALDGTGYPDRLIGSEVPHLVRLAAVVNTYDNHCNKADPSTSLTPYQALSYMFRNQIVQLDKEIVALLVRSVGVYPPGTIVELSNGSVGLVVSVNSTNSLRPGILLYDSSIPRNEALIIEMEDDPDLSIVKSIHPGKLSAEIFNYLSPRTRVVYFAEPLARTKA